MSCARSWSVFWGPIAWAALSVAIGWTPRPAAAQTGMQWYMAREQMVARDIVSAGIKNPRVINTMRKTPRHEFVLPTARGLAYFDMALPIGEQQTISPPFVVANMTAQLDPQPGDKALEIGTGSGYQAAVLAGVVKEVYSIEIQEPLAQSATKTLARLGYQNVHVKLGDGFQGWPDEAPFDKIIVTCSPDKIPQPLVDQLREGGRMVIPLGERYQQVLYLMEKKDGKLVSQAIEPTFFVPMTGTAEERARCGPTTARWPWPTAASKMKGKSRAFRPAGTTSARPRSSGKTARAPSAGKCSCSATLSPAWRLNCCKRSASTGGKFPRSPPRSGFADAI